jgi:hypothetical protein
MFDSWNSDSKRKCTLTYTPLLLDTFSIEYPLVFPIDYSEIRFGFNSSFRKKSASYLCRRRLKFHLFRDFLEKGRVKSKTNFRVINRKNKRIFYQKFIQ